MGLKSRSKVASPLHLIAATYTLWVYQTRLVTDVKRLPSYFLRQTEVCALGTDFYPYRDKSLKNFARSAFFKKFQFSYFHFYCKFNDFHDNIYNIFIYIKHNIGSKLISWFTNVVNYEQ